MTIAICLRCGQRKTGALVLCSHCGFDPKSPLDKAGSLALTDHYLNEAQLETAATFVGEGGVTHAPKEFVEKEFVEAMRVTGQDKWLLNGLILGLGAILLLFCALFIFLMSVVERHTSPYLFKTLIGVSLLASFLVVLWRVRRTKITR